LAKHPSRSPLPIVVKLKDVLGVKDCYFAQVDNAAPVNAAGGRSLGFDCVNRTATLDVVARDEVAAGSGSSVKNSAGAHGWSFREVAAETARKGIERNLRAPFGRIRWRRELI
jgi:hypothetical protein